MGVVEWFHVFLVLVLTQLYVFVKTHNCALKRAHFVNLP